MSSMTTFPSSRSLLAAKTEPAPRVHGTLCILQYDGQRQSTSAGHFVGMDFEPAGELLVSTRMGHWVTISTRSPQQLIQLLLHSVPESEN